MDTALFVGMSGAKEAMRSLQMVSNNLANSNTIGFRGDYEIIKSYPTIDNPMQTRIYSAPEKTYSDFNSGPILETGNELDVAVSGSGFIAVQTKEGKEGLTRAGNLRVNEQGMLTTSKGELVLGTKGVIVIPPANHVEISESGIVSAQLKGQNAKDSVQIGTIKLVDPALADIQKGADGLFYLGENATAVASDTVKLIPGAVEGSNVNPVKGLTQLIEISRTFEMHAKLMHAIEENAGKSNQLLDVTE